MSSIFIALFAYKYAPMRKYIDCDYPRYRILLQQPRNNIQYYVLFCMTQAHVIFALSY